MKREDIKECDVLLLRNGNVRIVLYNEVYCELTTFMKDMWCEHSLMNYTSDFKYEKDNSYDIVEVYRYSTIRNAMSCVVHNEIVHSTRTCLYKEV